MAASGGGAPTASLDDLKQALVETLDRRGVLGQVKAKVRSEIFAALDDDHEHRPELPPENVIINELFREYCEYNGYHHTLSVLLPESGHPTEPQLNRQFMLRKLHLQEEERSRSSLPLIYSLVRGLRPDDAPVPPEHPQTQSAATVTMAANAAAAASASAACNSFPAGNAGYSSSGIRSSGEDRRMYGDDQQLAPMVIHGGVDGNRPAVGR